MDTEFGLEALDDAMTKSKPDIFNTDQWAHLTHSEFAIYCLDNWEYFRFRSTPIQVEVTREKQST